MKYKNNYLFRLALCLPVFIYFSCGLSYKTIAQLKNPKVYTLEEVKKLRDRYFKDKLSNDFYFEKKPDSLEIFEILNQSFNGNLNIFSANGQQLCVNNTTSCSAYDFQEVSEKKSEAFTHCLKDSQNFNIINKRFLKNLDSELPILNHFSDADYIVLFFWSSFVHSKGNIRDEYMFIIDRMNKSNLNYKILRINTDLLDLWGLEAGEKLNMKIKVSKEKNQAEIKYGSLPWAK